MWSSFVFAMAIYYRCFNCPLWALKLSYSPQKSCDAAVQRREKDIRNFHRLRVRQQAKRNEMFSETCARRNFRWRPIEVSTPDLDGLSYRPVSCQDSKRSRFCGIQYGKDKECGSELLRARSGFRFDLQYALEVFYSWHQIATRDG